jgi:hypothetical protein
MAATGPVEDGAMTLIPTRAALRMCLAGCLACAGCRGEPDRLNWKSAIAWRPFRPRTAEVAATPEPALGADSEVNESLGEAYPAGPADGSWAGNPQDGETLPATAPLAPLAPPADYESIPVPEFPYMPEPTRSTSQPQSTESPGLRRRPKLSEFIDGIREGRSSDDGPKSIPWDKPVANAGMDVDEDELTLAPLVVAFEQPQPVTLGAPEFDGAAARPESRPIVEVAAPAPRKDGLTVFEREFRAVH